MESDARLIAELLKQDQNAFREVIGRYQAAMLSLARNIAGSAIADEIVQESWLAIIKALPRFERRSSLKTWILRIVANEAKTGCVERIVTNPWILAMKILWRLDSVLMVTG